MKKALLCCAVLPICFSILVMAAEERIKACDSKEKVLSVLGKPQGRMKWGDEEILTYDAGEVTLVNGRVTHCKLLSKEALARKRPRQAQAEAKPEQENVPHAEEETQAASPSGEMFDFGNVSIDNVPVPPFFIEAQKKVNIIQNPVYQSMPRVGGNRHIVDPFYMQRSSGRMPKHSYRQFTTSSSMQEILDWYKEKATPSPNGIDSDFADGGGFYSNGPFDDAALNLGTNDGRNFIVISAMKREGDGTTTVYIFHYRK